MIYPGYYIEEGWDRVGDGRPVFRTRFRWRAERHARKLNARLVFPSFRYEVVEDGNRWGVVAFQNYARER